MQGGDKAGLDVGYNYKRLTTLLFCLHRKCYITNDAINNRRSDFLRVLNASYRVGCLQCSFTSMTYSEAEAECERLKCLTTAKAALMKEVDMETWDEVEAAIPKFSRSEALQKFHLQKGSLCLKISR